MALVSLGDVNISRDGELLFKTISNHSILHPVLDKYSLYQETIDMFKTVLSKKLNYNIKLFKIVYFNNEFCGFIMSYDYKFNDCHIKILACLSKYNWDILGESLYTTYLNIVFSYYNLRKVYIETCSINEEEILFLEKFGFTEELNLQNYYTYNGSRVNKLFYSIEYDTFYEKYRSSIDFII